MTKIALLSTFCILVLLSCKVREKNFIGSYKLDRFLKTTLRINPDKSFEFSKNNANLYLHPFDHPAEYYSITRGIWTKVNNNTISLTSQSDTLIYPLATIQALPPRNKDLSYFSFFDSFGDTVSILYVQFTDGSIAAKMHMSMDIYIEDLTRRDTLEFHLYGYRPYLFISGQKKNMDYIINLKPGFQPDFFRATEFRIKRNRLIDIQKRGKFRKQTNGI